jgi:hypothetical protein
VPDENKTVLNRKEYSGDSIPLNGYYDMGMPPTGHDSWFGPMTGGGPINSFYYNLSPFSVGFGLGWGLRGDGFRYNLPGIINFPPSTTTISYSDTIINNWTINNPYYINWWYQDKLYPPLCSHYSTFKDHSHSESNPYGPPTSVVPEPSNVVLMASGIPVVFGLFRFRKWFGSYNYN